MTRTLARWSVITCALALVGPVGHAAGQSCEDGRTAAAPPLPNWGFEYELVGWTAEGQAFANQPTIGNNVKVARRPADGQAPPTLGGDYWVNAWQDFVDGPLPIGHKGAAWIGTYEDHPRTTTARLGDVQGDGPKGRLTSSQFTLTRPWVSFLVGGGDVTAGVRVELQVLASDLESLGSGGGTVLDRVGCYATVQRAAGQRSEVMQRVSWDVSRLVRAGAPLRARIMIVDDGDGGWGHINVDDLQFTAARPAAEAVPAVPIFGFADTHAHPVANLGGGGLYWGKVGGNWRTTDVATDLGGDDSKGHGAATITGQLVATVLEDQALTYFANRLDARTVAACSAMAVGLLEIAQAELRHPGPHTVAMLAGAATTSVWRLLQVVRGWATTPLAKPLEPCLEPALDQVMQHYGGGPPRFMGWPKWSSTIHQGMHITWIRRSYEGGQRLMSALVVNPAIFEYVMKPAGAPLTPDRVAIERQVSALRDLVAANREWMEIALSAADARRIIAANKLAIVLGTEVDTLGNLGFATPDDEVAWLYGLGIRQVTPVHFVDNLLGAPAIYNDLFNTLDNFVSRSQPAPRTGYPGWYEVEDGCPDWRSRECLHFRLAPTQWKAADAKLFGTDPVPFIDVVGGLYPKDDYFGPKLIGQRNKGGLTALGDTYLRALMKRGMIIAVDHMGDHTLDATLALAESKGYPVLSDHADFRAQALVPESETGSDHKVAHESTKTRAAAQRILGLGGMISPITIPQDVADGPGWIGARVANDNPGSSRTWAQKYLYAVELAGRGGFVGVGTDYAFLGKPSPRFGTDTAALLADDLVRARMFFPAYPAKPESVALARRSLGLQQGQGVKYDSPIREYRYHDRFQSTAAWSQEERDIWEAIAAVKAGRNPFAAADAGGLEGPSTLVERTIFQQNKIVNLAKGFVITTATSEEATGRHGFIALGDNSYWERRAAWLAKTAPAGAEVVPAALRSPDDGPEVARLYGVIKPIWDLWARMEQGLGASQPALKRLVTLGRDFDYNLDGFANYGMLPDFLQDLRNIGLHDLDASGARVPGPSILSPLMRSAEGYVRLWEKATARAR